MPSDIGEFEEDIGTDKNWTKFIGQRRTMAHQRITFDLFYALEEEVQLQLKSLPGQTTSRKQEMIQSVLVKTYSFIGS